MSETTWLDEMKSATATRGPGQPRTQAGIERVAEMRKLRESGATCQQIADKFDISRERVRQIIGNTGHKAYEVMHRNRSEVIENSKHLTTPELCDVLGLAASAFIKRDHHHPIAGNGPATRGNQAELQAAKILQRNGFTVELMPIHHPFDILVNGTVRVDVKAAFTPVTAPSVIARTVSPVWRFNVRGNTRDKCDFYFCMIVDTEDVFLIPAKSVPSNMIFLTFCYPTERPELAKWQNYHDAYDLLEAAAIKAEYTAPAITLETDLETTAGSPRGEPDGLMEELKP